MVRIAIVLSLLFTAASFGQTITNVTNESGAANLCPGGVAFVQGSGLGNTSTIVTVAGKNAYVFNAANGASLQFQVPVDAPLGPTTVKAGNSAPFNVTLVQYCPALPVNNPGSIAAAFHQASGFPVTAGAPATPREAAELAKQFIEDASSFDPVGFEVVLSGGK
jgi:hypothetical protein